MTVADAFECLAQLAAEASNQREAARLFGMADGARQELGVARFTIFDAEHEHRLAAIQNELGENDFRAEAIGYRTIIYRTWSNVLAAGFATLAGALLAIWLRYNGPDTSLSFEVMLDVLLIVVIGGMGTIYGAAIGSGLFVVAQSYLQDLLKLGSDAVSGLPWLPALLSPDRWLLWLGLLFVLSVYYFPTGIVGRLRALRARP